jgi:glycosyltransferase involved in cell wall biosynthesis
MKKVCMFDFPRMEDFYGYSLDSIDPVSYFPGANSRWRRRLTHRQFLNGKFIDQMYRERNPSYMRFVGDFVDKFRDADLVVLSTYNPVHPEVLCNELEKPIKVLGFVDDPHSTYMRGISYLWAFDGAFYISPSYHENLLFRDALERWGCGQSRWFPESPCFSSRALGRAGSEVLAIRNEALRRGDAFFRDRDLDVIYVGGMYRDKVGRLNQLRRHFGSRLKVYGRWPLAGYGGVALGLLGKPAFWGRVSAISELEKAHLYYRTKIGFNLHQSLSRRESGNMRMYEAPAHGMMLVCDKAGLNAHEQIFEPDKEAVFYDSIKDAIEKIEYYLEHDDEREAIARAGFERVRRDYDWEANLKNFLDWASGLPKKRQAKP